MDLVADAKAQDSSRHALAMDGHTESSGPVVSALCSVAVQWDDHTLYFPITAWLL